MNALIDGIGLIAGLLTTIAFIPQVRSVPLILTNAVTLVLSLAIIALKIRYRQRARGGEQDIGLP